MILGIPEDEARLLARLQAADILLRMDHRSSDVVDYWDGWLAEALDDLAEAFESSSRAELAIAIAVVLELILISHENAPRGGRDALAEMLIAVEAERAHAEIVPGRIWHYDGEVLLDAPLDSEDRKLLRNEGYVDAWGVLMRWPYVELIEDYVLSALGDACFHRVPGGDPPRYIVTVDER